MFEKRFGKRLGKGKEKEVFEDLENPKLAIGVFHEEREESPHRIKARFYLTKILSLIFPGNIPDIHLSSTNPHVIIVDKVGGREIDIVNREDNIGFNTLGEKIESFGIDIDPYAGNFKRDEAGEIKYVDSLIPWSISEGSYLRVNYNSKKLESALRNLDEDKKAEGLIYLQRLEALKDEEARRLKNIEESSANYIDDSGRK